MVGSPRPPLAALMLVRIKSCFLPELNSKYLVIVSLTYILLCGLFLGKVLFASL